jgi:predicted PurR-regulated permease PerM
MSDSVPAPVPSRRDRILQSAESKHVPLRTIVVTVVVVAGAFLVGKLLYRLRDVLILVAVGGFIALILNPQVVALQKWKVPRRGMAVGIVTLWAVLVFAGLAVAFGYPLVNSITHLANNLPSYIEKAERSRSWVGHLIRRYHIANWVQKNSPKLASVAGRLGKPALAIGKSAASVIVALVTTFVFVVLLLLEAPKMKTGILNAMSPGRAAKYTRIGAEISRSMSGYMLGDTLTSLVAGIVVFVTLTILSVPFAGLWAIWVALVDFLPTVGGAMAGIPTVLFALAHSFTAGVVTAVVFLLYTFLENHVLNPVIMSRTVKVNPLLIMMSVLVGADIGIWIGGLFGGFAAALLAIPVAGAVQIVGREVWNVTGPGPVGEPAVPLQSQHIEPSVSPNEKNCVESFK